RVIVNIVFFVILILVLSLLFGDDRPVVPRSTALVVAPRGAIVDQLTSRGGFKNAAENMMGLGIGAETLLKDLVDAIDMAADDGRVKVLLLDLDGLGGGGLTKLQDLKAALNRFKKSSKKVIASADNYNRGSYYLAAHADEVYLHHMGLVILDGYSRYKRYYKEGLDKLEIDMNVFRVGKFKSAVEPYTRSSMSEEAKEANLRWVGVLWDSYLADVAAARKITVEELKAYTDQFSIRLKDVKGETATLALKTGLVDHVTSRDEVRDRLIELVGENKKKHTFRQIGYKSYLAALDKDTERWGDNARRNVIAVVVAKGSILNGTQPPGNIGGDSTAAMIRKARKNKKVKAIVLKVDSGGGSAFASEVIRRELELARKDGKPVVASMGSVAASGGYWITMAADEVWAYPTTITGSIGILGMFPTYQKPLAKHLGIRVDGVGTNKLAGTLRQDRELSPEVADIIQQIINKGYNDFITKAAKARKMEPEKLHEYAQGRVWIGADAHKLGLIDHLGSFDDALKSAAKLAKLGDNFNVKYIRKKPGFKEQLMEKFFAETGMSDSLNSGMQVRQPLNPMTGIIKMLYRQMEVFSKFNDPNGVYAYWPGFVE
ncbi:MAG: signal peptide peptidase SppA, partial [bacterium]|nr:signal peptide peptidase SppA [bacterium]